MAATGSTSGQPQFIASTGNRSFSNAPLIENPDADRIVVPDLKRIYRQEHNTSMGYFGSY